MRRLGGPRAITLYSGQHEQTTALLVAAFERQTGIKVNLRSADEATLGNQILQEGSNSPADVFYSENTPVLEALPREGPARARAPQPPSRAVPTPLQLAAGAVGRRLGARVGARLQHPSKLGPPSCRARSSNWPKPQLEGQARVRALRDRLPAARHVDRPQLDGQAAAERWLKGLQANGTVYPDNETVVVQVNNGESALGPINHYYWYRLRDELGAGGMHSALHYYAPGDAGDLLNVSGAAVLASSPHKTAAQALPRVPRQPRRPGGDRPQPQLRVPAAAGRRSRAGACAAREAASPRRSPRPQLGDGSSALELEQKLGLL